MDMYGKRLKKLERHWRTQKGWRGKSHLHHYQATASQLLGPGCSASNVIGPTYFPFRHVAWANNFSCRPWPPRLERNMAGAKTKACHYDSVWFCAIWKRNIPWDNQRSDTNCEGKDRGHRRQSVNTMNISGVTPPQKKKKKLEGHNDQNLRVVGIWWASLNANRLFLMCICMYMCMHVYASIHICIYA